MRDTEADTVDLLWKNTAPSIATKKLNLNVIRPLTINLHDIQKTEKHVKRYHGEAKSRIENLNKTKTGLSTNTLPDKKEKLRNLWNYNKRLEPYQTYAMCGSRLDPDSSKPILQIFMRQWGKFGH